MPSLTLPSRLIWFAHCPKAGGTSLEQVMVATWGSSVGHLHWGWDRWWRKGGWRVAGPPCSPQHLIWNDALGTLPRAPDHVFALVRDPLTRMQSEHRWQRRGRRATPLGRAVARLPFAIWLRVMLTLVERSPYAFDNHLRAQDDFLPEGARVFRLEDGLGRAADWLETVAGQRLAHPVGHALATPRQDGQVTPRDAALIARAFARDYARFGYTPPPPVSSARPLVDALARVAAPVLATLDARGLL